MVLLLSSPLTAHPNPSHPADLTGPPPGLCALVVGNARAAFHTECESEQPRARRVSGGRFSGAAGCPQPRGDGSFGDGSLGRADPLQLTAVD